ncbi:MAG: sigma-54 dependent transcriptional regulator [Betaproteobacteria bacterium]|nr:sigma-54 dependent transcriptional regulator [Betaproteobacteria bacterium]
MPTLNILVIDDERALRQMLAAMLGRAGYVADQAGGVAEAAAKLKGGDFDVALCDIKMADGNGINLVRDSRAAGIDTVFIMITAFASLETAVEALRAGASDYIIKPVRSEELLNRLSSIDTLRRLSDENRALRRAMADRAPKLYRCTSPPMLEVERLIERVAAVDSTVLVTGESGTGKGVVARAIHAQSKRRDGQFLSVNCSAIPEHLLESEFFGHTKGAFTGADRTRKGLFLQASAGTLFLDEIGDLPLPMQAKLLNVIEDKEVRPVGSEQVRRIDTRIIAATNANLKERVSQGRFRDDLYFRLSMLEIHIPPLRERPADLRGLMRFLLRACEPEGEAAELRKLDPLAEEILLAYGWPGNVRELENVIRRACLLAENGHIGVSDLGSGVVNGGAWRAPAAAAPGADEPLRERMRTLEAGIIQREIEAAGGDRRLAAHRLGIGLSTLYRKLEELERGGLVHGAALQPGVE